MTQDKIEQDVKELPERVKPPQEDPQAIRGDENPVTRPHARMAIGRKPLFRT